METRDGPGHIRGVNKRKELHSPDPVQIDNPLSQAYSM